MHTPEQIAAPLRWLIITTGTIAFMNAGLGLLGLPNGDSLIRALISKETNND